jgi:hypothetical protein
MFRRIRSVALAALCLSLLAAALGFVPVAYALPKGIERAGTNLCHCPTEASSCTCDAFPV